MITACLEDNTMKTIEFAAALASGINLGLRHLLVASLQGAAATTSAAIQPRVSVRRHA